MSSHRLRITEGVPRIFTYLSPSSRNTSREQLLFVSDQSPTFEDAMRPALTLMLHMKKRFLSLSCTSGTRACSFSDRVAASLQIVQKTFGSIKIRRCQAHFKEWPNEYGGFCWDMRATFLFLTLQELRAFLTSPNRPLLP